MNEDNDNSTTSPALVEGGTGYNNPHVERTSIGCFITYEVQDIELESLIKGDDGGVYLNICIAALTTFISLIITIITCTFPSDLIKGIFIAVCLFSLLISGYMFYKYKSSENKKEILYNRIIHRN